MEQNDVHKYLESVVFVSGALKVKPINVAGVRKLNW